jgi:hypothetical protein
LNLTTTVGRYRYIDAMKEQSNNSNSIQIIYILTGTSGEYTAVRQQLGLTPSQAFWLTGASRLNGLSSPRVYRVGSWRTLARIEAIEAALAKVEAEIIDL